MSKASKKYAKTARALYKAVPALEKSYPVPLVKSEDQKELRRLKKLRPSENFSYVDAVVSDLKGKAKLPFSHRLTAVNFFLQNFQEGSFNDTLIAELQSLLVREYNRGVEFGRRYKKRTK